MIWPAASERVAGRVLSIAGVVLLVSGLAVLVATTFPEPRTAVLAIGYLPAMLVATAPYLRWRKRRAMRRCASPDG